MCSQPEPAKGREVPEKTREKPPGELPPLSSLIKEKMKIGLYRIAGSLDNLLEKRELVFAETFLHRPGMLEVTSKIFDGSIMMGMDDYGVGDINSLKARL